jgi:hypothetical protein
MKQITLQIPDNKFQEVIEFLHGLGVKDIHENDLYIPEWQKNIVRERIETYQADKTLSLHEFESYMQTKYGI